MVHARALVPALDPPAGSDPPPAASPRRLLSVLVPAYDEARTIGVVLERLCAIDLALVGFDHEVVVCDDGSRDATAAIVEAVAARHPRVRLIRHGRNRGKGAAIRTALAAARGAFCLIQDADLEYDVADYPALLAALGPGVRAVYGSRFAREPWPRGMRWPNYLANRILTATANALYGLAITDEATCLKLVDTALLRELDLRCDGFDFCPEVTAKLGRRAERIVEVPVAYRARSGADGKKIRWTDGVQAFRVLVRHRLGR